MLKIIGNDVMRSGEKIGHLQGTFDHTGRKIGYYHMNDIYDRIGKRIGYIDHFEIRDADGKSVASIAENRLHVSGGAISDLARAAVRLLLLQGLDV